MLQPNRAPHAHRDSRYRRAPTPKPQASGMFLLAALGLLPSCDDAGPPSLQQPAGQTPTETGATLASAPIRFEDLAAASGLDFVHHNGMLGELYFVETVGAGAALADFDGDGLSNIFEVTHGYHPFDIESTAGGPDASHDPDADGLGNATEQASGTNPMNKDNTLLQLEVIVD